MFGNNPAGGGSSASGDVVGPASSLDNAIARYDSTTGKLIQGSLVLLNDAGSAITMAAGSTYAAPTIGLPFGGDYSGYNINTSGRLELIVSNGICGDVNTAGQLTLSTTGTLTPTSGAKLTTYGAGSTTGKNISVKNSSGTETFYVQDNGDLRITGTSAAAGYSEVRVKNSTGTGYARFAAENNIGDIALLYRAGTSSATYGCVVAQDSVLYGYDKGLCIVNDVSTTGIKFSAANGLAQQMWLSPAGGLAIGTATDAGAGNLLVNGITKPSGGILGVITNSNPTAGHVGEVISSAVAVGSHVSLTTATAANITSISLTAGDWLVSGNANFDSSAATVTATTASIGSTSATLATDGTEGYSNAQTTILSGTDTVTLPSKRISLSGTTTVYLVGQVTFSAGTANGFGSISAVRIR